MWSPDRSLETPRSSKVDLTQCVKTSRGNPLVQDRLSVPDGWCNSSDSEVPLPQVLTNRCRGGPKLSSKREGPEITHGSFCDPKTLCLYLVYGRELLEGPKTPSDSCISLLLFGHRFPILFHHESPTPRLDSLCHCHGRRLPFPQRGTLKTAPNPFVILP